MGNNRSGKRLSLPRLTLDYHEFVQTNESKPVRQLIPDPGAHLPDAVQTHLPTTPRRGTLVGALMVTLGRYVKLYVLRGMFTLWTCKF